MDAEEFRRAAHSAVDEIIDYFSTIDSKRVVSDVSPGYLRPLLPSGPPEEGEKWEDIQKDIAAKIMPGLTHWQSPNFMAFFPANATYPSLLGELYSAAFTAPAFNWLCSPACTELETIVLDWLCSALHLPSSYLSTSSTGGGGVIQGSASEAIVTVMIAAREKCVRQHVEAHDKNGLWRSKTEDEKEWQLRSKLVALGSEMSHSSTQKASMIAGVKYRSIPVSAADEHALTGRGLKKALEDITREGLVPFYLTVTLGTTSTCAVDRFEEIADIKKEYPSLWIHVDAAYAGAALLLEEYQELTKGLEMFDSFDVNMHKWLLTNFDARYVLFPTANPPLDLIGIPFCYRLVCLFLPRREPLISALSITPSYLQNNYSASGLVTDYRDWQIPLGRRFRALKIWFVLRSHGINGLKRHVRRHIELGEKFAGWVGDEGNDLFEVVSGPKFALTVLRVKLPEENSHGHANGPINGDEGRTETKINEGVANGHAEHLVNGVNGQHKTREAKMLDKANTVTREVYERINAGGEIFLTATMIKDVYAIRVVSANEQTDEAHLRKAFNILMKTTNEVFSKGKQNGKV
ncbi:MAG: hypothetical protein LQ338_000882 [Usnochroma carphineum]|nr:MAG: hypothetical protein LQ338_000882 [Usnochroma carphineum]